MYYFEFHTSANMFCERLLLEFMLRVVSRREGSRIRHNGIKSRQVAVKPAIYNMRKRRD